MKEVEVHLVTRRPISPRFIEMFNWQTCKDFTLKILTRYPQSWSVEDLNVDFPVELKHTKLAYSTGTKYAVGLAKNEIWCSAKTKYVLDMDDFTMMSPISVEQFLIHADEGTFMGGRRQNIHETWEEYGLDYNFFKNNEAVWKPAEPVFANVPANDFYFTIGFALFPLDALKKVNGLDLAFDGGWGTIDINLGQRLMRAGFKYAELHSAVAFHFKHIWHGHEHDDPPISGGSYIYNKETGARMDWKRGGGNYQQWCIDNNVIRAPQGLQEVWGLLNK